MSKFNIIFQPEGKRVDIEEGNTILAAALKTGIDLTSICSGKGICGKCKIIINDIMAVNQINTKELEFLTPAEIEDNVRLACLTKVIGNLVVKVPESSRTGKQRLQIEGIDTSIEINPSVSKYYIELEFPTLEDPRSDADRLLEFLQEKHSL